MGQGLLTYGPEIHAWSFDYASEYLALRVRYEEWLDNSSSEDIVGLLEDTRALILGVEVPCGMRHVEFLRNCETALGDPPNINLVL